MNRNEALSQLADVLWQASSSRVVCEPIRHSSAQLNLGLTQDNAYAVQRLVRSRRLEQGDRCIGRKIGLTSASVQKQLGVDQPDFGCLWSSTLYGDGSRIPVERLMQPKVEGEVALVMKRNVGNPDASVADLIAATAFALPAIEIVGSRIRNWDISLFDTIADNASSDSFVLGADPRPLDRLCLRRAGMRMRRNGEIVSEGNGRACLGHPLNAAVWLARKLASMGDPLQAGDIVLTGALGPMVTVEPGDEFELDIDGLEGVAISFD